VLHLVSNVSKAIVNELTTTVSGFLSVEEIELARNKLFDTAKKNTRHWTVGVSWSHFHAYRSGVGITSAELTRKAVPPPMFRA